jgi:O-antigen/teichoic acid export membrane protein
MTNFGNHNEANETPGEPAAAAADEGAAVARGSGQIFTARIVGNTGYFFAVLVLGRALDPTERGVFAFITTAAQILAVTASLGARDMMTVFAARTPARRPTFLANVVLFVVGTTILAGGIVGVVAFAFKDSLPSAVTFREVLLLVLGAVVTAVAGVSDGYLIGTHRIRLAATVSAILPWLYAAALGLLAGLQELNTDSSMLVWVGTYATWMSVSLFFSIRVAGIGPPNLAELKKMVGFSVRIWPGSLTRLLNYRTDQILLGLMSTAAALGVYAVAVNVSEILLQLPSAAATALVPVLARAAPEDRARRALSVFRLLMLIGLIEIVVAALAGPVLIPLVFGSQYHASVTPFLLLLPGTIGFIAADVFTSSLMTQGAPSLSSLPSVVALASGLILDVLLIPSFGASGAALAATAAFFAGGTTAFIAFRRLNDFSLSSLRPGPADLSIAGEVWRRFRGRTAQQSA